MVDDADANASSVSRQKCVFMASGTRGLVDLCGNSYPGPLAERFLERMAFRGAVLANAVDHEGSHLVAV